MSADRFTNALKMHAQTMDRGLGQVRMALVSTVNAAAGLLRAVIQPEQTSQTGPLPMCSPWVGNGWGFYAPPLGGEQFVMLPQEGDGEHLIAAMPIWSQAMQPPPAAAGECWIKHRTGALVKLTNDGKVTVADASGASAVFANNGTVAVTGVLNVVGTLKVNGTTVTVP